MIRIMLVDDHPVLVQGLEALLRRESDFEVVGSASDGAEAVAKAGQLKPDVVLMDVRMKGTGGIEATAQIKELHPEISVILLTVYDADIYVAEAIRAGASAYLIKDSEPELLLETRRTAASGGVMFPPEALQEALQSEAAGNDLTARELEVLNLLAGGKSNKVIASQLHLAEVTIKKHVQSLMRKLGASDRTQAAVLAVELGLIRR